MDMKKRTYEMRARGEATAATHDAIIDSAIATFESQRSVAITLAAVAATAGVTVKTVLRHFGSREGLVEAAWKRIYADVMAERAAPPDDRDAALRILIGHYETRGLVVLGVLADEDKDPWARRVTDAGRTAHRSWVVDVFGADLPTASDQRQRLVDVLVIATDIYSWKLLRVDRDLPVDVVHDRMKFLTEAILARERTEP